MRPRFEYDYGIKFVLLTLRSLIAATSSIASATATDGGLTLLCCNGGIPYILRDHTFPHRDLIFRPTNATNANTGCVLYRGYTSVSNQEWSTFGSKDQSFGLACRCQPGSGYFGDRCELRNEALREDLVTTENSISGANTASLASNENGSFKIFLFIAIIPLSFALLAGFGAFLCRMCFCDCFALHDSCKKCWSKDPYNLERNADLAQEALMDRHRASYRYEMSSDLVHRTEDRTADTSQRLCRDPPPPFTVIDRDGDGRNTGGLETVITVQPKPESCAPVHRKYSPPPPYTATADQTVYNSDAATQTGDNQSIV